MASRANKTIKTPTMTAEDDKFAVSINFWGHEGLIYYLNHLLGDIKLIIFAKPEEKDLKCRLLQIIGCYY